MTAFLNPRGQGAVVSNISPEEREALARARTIYTIQCDLGIADWSAARRIVETRAVWVQRAEGER